MYAQAEKPKENKSRAIANSAVQNTSRVKQTLAFVDNRSEAIQMKELCKPDACEPPSKTIMQCKTPTVVNRRDGNTKIELVAAGKVSEFSGGDDPGGEGWNGVEIYQADCQIDGHTEAKTDPLDNNYLQAHAGHVLAKQNGGYGDKDNIFAQDGGVNTTGPWRTFENDMRSALDEAGDDDDVQFIMLMAGENITQGELDRDHMGDVDFTDSQKEFFDA